MTPKEIEDKISEIVKEANPEIVALAKVLKPRLMNSFGKDYALHNILSILLYDRVDYQLSHEMLKVAKDIKKEREINPSDEIIRGLTNFRDKLKNEQTN